MKQTVKLMMQLIKSEICNIPLDEISKLPLSEDEAQKLYKLSKMHDLAHIVGHAVKSNSLVEQDNLLKMFKKKLFVSVYRNGILEDEYDRVCEYFESKGISFLPLKGAVLKDCYPEVWMRTRCDIDILVDEKDIKRAVDLLTNEYGYKYEGAGTHDVSLLSPSEIHVELHHKLSEIYFENAAESLLEDVWKYSYLKDGFKYHLVLKDEFFYMYHIYHMAKHFEIGGCGIRPFIDLWLLDNRVAHDKTKRDELLRQCDLLKFADMCRKLSKFWLSDGEADETVLKMQGYIISGGAYGTTSNRHSLKLGKNDNRVKQLLGRVFLSYDKLKIQYPIIKEHKWLLPFYEVKRWFKLLKPEYRKIAKDDLQLATARKNEQSENMSDFLKQIGLK